MVLSPVCIFDQGAENVEMFDDGTVYLLST